MGLPCKFSPRLVWWRGKRALSQLQLAMAAACPQRHACYCSGIFLNDEYRRIRDSRA
jgi:hypothetical protein